jgi:formate/nitrite transporter
MIETFVPMKETAAMLIASGTRKARLPWPDLFLKSFLAGAFISLGALFDLVIASGAPSLRSENPSLVTLMASFTFPTGFVILTMANTELFTANLFVLVFTTCLRKTRYFDLARNLITTYFMNMAGALFVAGFLCWWSDTFSTNSQKSYAVAQSEARVNVQWSVNFLRGVGCNWFVGLAILMSISAHDHICKIYAIWIPIWTFVALGYQHCVANFFLVPIGMFYGTDFGVGKFINQSVIPVTLGNIVGGAVLNGVIIWFLYGRSETTAVKDNNGNLTGQDRLPS